METRWIERGEGASFTVEVNGVDAAKREAAEVASFARRAKLSVEETSPPEGKTAAADLALVFGAIAFAWFVLDALDAVIGPAHRNVNLYVGVSFAAFFVPLLVIAALRKRAKAAAALAPPFQDGFTFSFADGAFSFRGQKRDELRVPVEAIVAFEARRHGLSFVTTDGTRTELPCDLGAETAHRDLSARLGEELARARAAARGYRGDVRIANALAPTDDPEPTAIREGRASRSS